MIAAHNEAELRELLAALPPEELEDLAKELEAPAALNELHNGRPRAVVRHKVTACFDFSRIENAAAQIGKLPNQDEAVHFIMAGTFTTADLIPVALQLTGEPIAELYVATLGFSRANVDAFAAMLDERRIRKLALICSTYFRNTEGKIYDHALLELAEKRRVPIVKTRCHAKVILMKIGRRYFVAEGSANLRSCLALEQVSLTQSRKLYQFHRAWMQHVLDVEGAK